VVLRSLAEGTPCPRAVPPGLPPLPGRTLAVLSPVTDRTRDRRWHARPMKSRTARNFAPSLTPFLVLPRFLLRFLLTRRDTGERRTVPLPSVEATDQLCAAYRPPRYSLQLPSVASPRVDSRDASAISRARAINASPISRSCDTIDAASASDALRVDGSSRNRVVKMAAAPTSATLFMNGKRVIIVRHGPRETGGGDGWLGGLFSSAYDTEHRGVATDTVFLFLALARLYLIPSAFTNPPNFQRSCPIRGTRSG